MPRLISFFSATVFAASLFVAHGTRAIAQQNDKQAVETAIRTFAQALLDYDFAKANSFCTPDARWIDGSYPQSMPDVEKPFEAGKAAKIRMAYHFRDFEVRVEGNVAWVTDTLEGTSQADTEAGRKLLGGKSERRVTAVESEVLVKTPGGWKIVLGHSTSLPESKPK